MTKTQPDNGEQMAAGGGEPRSANARAPISAAKCCGVVAVMALCLAAAVSCTPKQVTLDFNNVPNNDRCAYMKDICREAEAFQAQFDGMTAEEKRDARQIQGAYVQQCEGAQELCRQTME